MLQNKQDIKVGILQECPWFPISKAGKRAMDIAEQAARDQGYQVVKVEYPHKFWDRAIKLTLEILANGGAPQMMKEFEKYGEVPTPIVANNSFMLNRS